MKTNFTFCSNHSAFTRFVQILVFLLSASFLYSCTSSAQDDISKKQESQVQNETSNNITTPDSPDNQQEFTFHQMKNGKDNEWRAIFRDGQLSELYKNKNRIPDENLEDYAGMVNEEIDGIQNNSDDADNSGLCFNFNMNMPDSTFEGYGNGWGNMNFDCCDSVFNNEQFQKNMKHLQKKLGKLNHMKFNINFDTAAFNKSMKELGRNLKNLNKNHPMHLYKYGCPPIDMQAFKEGMQNFAREMKHARIFNEGIHIDMSEFENNMKEFNKNMKNFSLNMKGFNENMKKFNAFLKELKQELVKDNLVKEGEEGYTMKFNADEMIINGKKVPDALLNKYKAIYKKHFGKEIDNDFKINTDDSDVYDIDH